MPQTYVPLARTTATGSTSNIDFNSIPQDYTDLVLVISGGSAGGGGIKWRANGDTTSSYYFTHMRGNSIGAQSARYVQTSGLVAWFATANLGGVYIANFMNYSVSGPKKSMISKGGYASSETTTIINTWSNTTAITSLSIFDEGSTNITAGSTFTLYGIKAA